MQYNKYDKSKHSVLWKYVVIAPNPKWVVVEVSDFDLPKMGLVKYEVNSVIQISFFQDKH